MVLTDDQHPAAIRWMPNLLSRLAAQGTVFHNAFASTPICAPSRATLLTGQYPVTHGVTANVVVDKQGKFTNGAFAFDDSTTIATRLQSAGYKTALLGKYMNFYSHLSPHVPPGWDEWRVFVEDINVLFDYTLNENGTHVSYGDEPSEYSTDVLANYALSFIEKNHQRPFFLLLAPMSPHDPSTPAPRHEGTIQSDEAWRPPNWNEKDISDKPRWFRMLTQEVIEVNLAKRTRGRLRQLEALQSVDEALGKILDSLDHFGIRDDTAVIFAADHGLGWGEHRWSGKQLAYEESIRIPLVIQAPGQTTHKEIDDLTLNLDIVPTIAELAGLHRGEGVEGTSLLALMENRHAGWRREIGLRHFKGGFLIPPWSAIRTQRYKLIYSGGKYELYDLERDAYELDSVIASPAYAGIRKQLKQRLRQLVENPNDPNEPDHYPTPVAALLGAG